MNRLAVIVTLVAPFVIPLSVLAAQSAKTGGELPDLPLEALYFGGENPALTPSEERALRIAREWQAKAATQLTPVPGPDGAIQFLYGAVQPSIVCAVMQVTDIELQPGEQINNINIGDSARCDGRWRGRSAAYRHQADGRRARNLAHGDDEQTDLPFPAEEPQNTVYAQNFLHLS